MSFIQRFLPILMFLLSITLLAEIATEAEVFARLAQTLSRLAKKNLLRLYLIVTVTASLITIFLGLDTTAVLFTPVVIALAQRVGAHVLPFVMATLLLSNTASLLLPVSNITNLLAQSKLGVTTHQYISHVFTAAIVSIGLSILLLLIRFRKSLKGSYSEAQLDPIADKILLFMVSFACLVFVVMVILNFSPVLSSVISASISVIVIHFRRRRYLTWDIVPWKLLLFTSFLFTAISVFNNLGLSRILSHLSHSQWEVLGSSALLANFFNNLPTYLAFETLQKTNDIYYVLIGTNLGSIVLPWGSLATLLWAQRCRASNVAVPWAKVISFSAVCAAVIVPICALFLQP